MQFNHVANRLDETHFDTIVELFEARLGFVRLRRVERAIWLRQPGTNVDLQFSMSREAGRDGDKLRSQIAFLSETPEADLKALAAWLAGKGLDASVGAYSTTEFYLDVPAAFVDFVIEAMRPELARYAVDV